MSSLRPISAQSARATLAGEKVSSRSRIVSTIRTRLRQPSIAAGGRSRIAWGLLTAAQSVVSCAVAQAASLPTATSPTPRAG